ncbi:MAG: hypothetical protein R3C03_06995 [Pirellulaceae bacterium]
MALLFVVTCIPNLLHARNANESRPAQTHIATLRISWGGMTEQRWQVNVTGPDITFDEVRLLGIDAETPGSWYEVEDGIAVSMPNPNVFGGADLSISGYSNSRISVELIDLDDPSVRFHSTLLLDDLIRSGINELIDSRQNRVSIARAPGDQLRVDWQAPHTILSPGEEIKFKVKPNLTSFTEGQSARLHVRLKHSRNEGSPILHDWHDVTIDQWGGAPSIDLRLTAPMDEGVYDIELSLEPSWYSSRLAARHETRQLQFIVLAKQVKRNVQNWQRLADVDLTSIRKSFDTWGLSFDLPFRFSPAEPRTVRASDKNLEIAPGASRVIPLPIDHREHLHRLTIEYESSDSPTLSFNIVQPDTVGNVSHFGFNSGITLPTELRWQGEAQPSGAHQLLFWPEHEQSFLVVRNGNRIHPISVSRVTLDERVDSGVPDDRSTMNSDTRGRLAFLELPLFAENFSGPKNRDPKTGEMLDDWNTFHVAADRLIQDLKLRNYSGAIVAVNGLGSAIYPSRAFEPSPRFDTGVFSSTGRDPIRKDVLEMLIRMFERENLSFVPAISTSDPIPSLEHEQRETGSVGELTLLDYRGRESGTQLGLPRYNAMSPSAQAAVKEIIDELTSRYGADHRLPAVALLCYGDSAVILPGQKWGYHPDSISRFLTSLSNENIDPSVVETPEQLLREHRDAWLDWRCRQITDLFLQCKKIVSQNTGGTFMVLPIDLFRAGDNKAELSPTLQGAPNPIANLKGMGWDLQQWKSELGNIAPPSHRLSPTQSLSQRRVEHAVEQNPEWLRAIANQSPTGEVFYHRNEWSTLEGAEDQFPQTLRLANPMRLDRVVSQGALRRRPFIEAIGSRDSLWMAEGGWTLGAGYESELETFFDAYRHLPSSPMDNVTSSSQPGDNPIVVRQRNTESGWIGYVINRSPWPVATTIHFEHSPRNLRIYGNASENSSLAKSDSRVPASQASFSSSREINLEPYGLAVLKSENQSKVLDFEGRLDDQARDRVRQHLRTLQNHLSLAAKPSPLDVLTDADCDNLSQWFYSKATGVKVQPLNSKESADETGFHVISNGEIAWLRGNWFCGS